MTRAVGIVAPLVLTGTTETTVGTFKVPAGVRKIEAVEVIFGASGGQTTLQGQLGYARLGTPDLKNNNIEPCYLLGYPIGTCLTTGAGSNVQQRAIYPLNCPVNGGETITVYGAELNTMTIHAELSVNIFYNDTGEDYPYARPGQYWYKIGTCTTSGTGSTTGTATSGTAYTIAGARRITMAYGAFVGTTMVTLLGSHHRFTLASPDYATSYPIDFMNRGTTGVVGTGGMPAFKADIELDIPVNTPCTITDTCTVYAAAAITAGKFITGVQFQ